MKRGLRKRLLGKILVDGGFISHADLEVAVEEQRHTNKLLGEILVSLNVLDPVDLDVVLSLQRELASLEGAIKLAAGVRHLIGELLLNAKRITPEQLDAALKERQITGERLGEVLVRRGLLTQGELEVALKFQSHQTSEISSRLRLGELMVTAGYITRDQLENALTRQRVSKKRLGEVLVEAGYAKPHQVAHGLKLQKMLVTAALTTALSLTSMPALPFRDASAQSASSKMTVSVIVKSSTSVRLLYQSPEMVITNADIHRGYVDANAATRLEIESNSPTGYMLSFESYDGAFKEIHVSGLGEKVIIGSGSGMVFLSHKGTHTMELSYRFILSKDAEPGTYMWPLSITVNPL